MNNPFLFVYANDKIWLPNIMATNGMLQSECLKLKKEAFEENKRILDSWHIPYEIVNDYEFKITFNPPKAYNE